MLGRLWPQLYCITTDVQLLLQQNFPRVARPLSEASRALLCMNHQTTNTLTYTMRQQHTAHSCLSRPNRSKCPTNVTRLVGDEKNEHRRLATGGWLYIISSTFAGTTLKMYYLDKRRDRALYKSIAEFVALMHRRARAIHLVSVHF